MFPLFYFRCPYLQTHCKITSFQQFDAKSSLWNATTVAAGILNNARIVYRFLAIFRHRHVHLATTASMWQCQRCCAAVVRLWWQYETAVLVATGRPDGQTDLFRNTNRRYTFVPGKFSLVVHGQHMPMQNAPAQALLSCLQLTCFHLFAYLESFPNGINSGSAILWPPVILIYIYRWTTGNTSIGICYLFNPHFSNFNPLVRNRILFESLGHTKSDLTLVDPGNDPQGHREVKYRYNTQN